MQTFVITLSPSASVDELWELLASRGAEFLFSEEDDQIQKIYLRCEPSCLDHPSIIQIDPYEIPAIDWTSQWEGKNELSLAPYGFPDKIIYMTPGGGFGDLSHPTTKLVCSMMSGVVPNKKVLDVGSGSGILSFAALAMGASEVVGVEIDPKAIEHAKENALLNGMDVNFYLPENTPPFQPDVILMNMIFLEQQQAWQSLQLQGPKIVITSGILAEQKNDYLRWAAAEGWHLENTSEEEGWLGLLFKKETSF